MGNQIRKGTYVCKKLKLYEHLTLEGFKPYKTAIDKWDCNRLVWLYDDCDRLQSSITKYYSDIR